VRRCSNCERELGADEPGPACKDGCTCYRDDGLCYYCGHRAADPELGSPACCQECWRAMG
jgi:hypothetical protein